VPYRFGDFELDESLYELRREGEAVELQPKVFDLLLYLIRHRDRVVSRDELLEKVWAGVVVNEEVLTRAVYAARSALGKSSTRESVIRTVRRRGFRFVAEVEESTPAAARAEPAKEEMERRLAAVLSANAAGYSRLLALDEAATVARLESQRKAMDALVADHGGRVVDTVRDNLLATFPSAVDAVQCAVAVQEELARRGADTPEERRLRFRIGIHLGEVLVDGRRLFGDAVNVAARLERLAAPGGFSVSEAVAQEVRGKLDLELEDAGERTLKGIEGPVHVFQHPIGSGGAVEATAAQARSQPASKPERRAPALPLFVGRDRILKQLEAALDDTFAGRGRIVLLSGEPGVGKSYTAEALAHTAREKGAYVFSGWGYEGGGAPLYWPWIQILRSALKTTDPEALPSLLGEGAAEIAQILPTLREELPSPPETARPAGRETQFRVFDAIANFLKNLSVRSPLLLIFDDLQWGDSVSLRLLEFFAREMADARVLVVGTHRDDALQPDEALVGTLAELARHPLCERLAMGGLAKEEVAELLTAVLGSRPPFALIETIAVRTGGNPFLIREIVRLLGAEGRLEELATIDPSRLRLPPTVKEVIRRRIARLSDDCRRTLAFGSVIGQEFGLELLKRVWPEPSAPELEWLEEGVTARVLREAPQGLGRYRFAHALIRETLYEDLGLARRVEFHRRTGEALEELYRESPEPHVSELARHFCEAVPGGGDVSKALNYAQRACERAERLFAWREAITHSERALGLLASLPDDEERARRELDLLLQRGRSLIATVGYASAEVEKAMRGAMELCQRLGDERLGTALAGLFGFHFVAGDYRRAGELADRIDREVALEALSMVGYLRGTLLTAAGRFEEACQELERGASTYDREKQPPAFVATALVQSPDVTNHSTLGLVQAALGLPERALRTCDEAIRRAEKSGNPFNLAFALGFAAIVHLLIGPTRETADLTSWLFTISSERGIAVFRAVARLVAGWARTIDGAVEEGIRTFESGLADLQTTGTRFFTTLATATLSDVYARAGRVSEALSILEGAESFRRTSGEEFYAAELSRLRGDLLVGGSPENDAEAERCFEQALAISRAQAAKLFELRAALSLGRLWQRQGKKAEARRLVTEVYDWFSEGHDTPHLVEAKRLIQALSS
jgi:class 3 adenylate cyclase/tetratricopeptide (TPR) repeat protein